MAVQKQPTRERISLRRDNFVAGGVCPEGDYEVKESSIVIFQYAEKGGALTGAVTCAHRLLLQPLNAKGEAEGAEVDQNYSIGDTGNYAPSADGNHIEMVGTKTTLSSSCNFYIGYDNLLNAGVPEDLLDEQGMGLLVGMRGHVAHIPAPDRSNLRTSPTTTGVIGQPKRDFPKTIPVFKSIQTPAPWDKNFKAKKAAPAVAAKVAGKTNGAVAAAAPAEAASDTRLADMIKEVLTANNGSLGRTQLRLKVHRSYNQAKIEAGVRDAELAVFDSEAELADVLASISCDLENDVVTAVS